MGIRDLGLNCKSVDARERSRKVRGAAFRSIVRGLFFIVGLKRRHCSQIELWGGSDFLEAGYLGICALRETDAVIFSYFDDRQFLLFQSFKFSMIAHRKQVIGIPDSYISWGKAGVIAWLVYVFYADEATESCPWQRTTAWMEKHGIGARFLSQCNIDNGHVTR